jgi:hypothetical protein
MLTGTGKSKKLAKRQAAHKMWEKLQDSPISSSSMMPGLDDDDEVCAGIRRQFVLSVGCVGHCCCIWKMLYAKRACAFCSLSGMQFL